MFALKTNLGVIKAQIMANLSTIQDSNSVRLENYINCARWINPSQREGGVSHEDRDEQEILEPFRELKGMFDSYLTVECEESGEEDEEDRDSDTREQYEDDDCCDNPCVGIEDGVDILSGIESVNHITSALIIIGRVYYPQDFQCRCGKRRG